MIEAFGTRLRRSYSLVCLLAPTTIIGVAAPSAGSEVTWTNEWGGSWHDASNWSSSPNLPGPDDSVTISMPANLLVDHSQTATSIASLILRNRLAVLGGTLEVAGELLMDHTELAAQGPTSHFRASGHAVATNTTFMARDAASLFVEGSAELKDVSFRAESAAQVRVPLASQVGLISDGAQAVGAGSLIDLHGAITVTGGENLILAATEGGQIDLSQTKLIEAPGLRLACFGGGSAGIDLSSLESITSPVPAQLIVTADSNQLTAPVLREILNLNAWFIANGADSILDLPALRTLHDSEGLNVTVHAHSGTISMPSLADISANSLLIQADTGVVDLSGLESFAGHIFAQGGGRIDLSRLREVSDGISVWSGGLVDLGQLTTVTGSGEFSVSCGSGGTVDLSSLVRIDRATMFVSEGGRLRLPSGAVSVANASLTLAPGGLLEVGNLHLESSTAFLNAAGLVRGDVLNSGVLSPTFDPFVGITSIEGSYAQTPAGTLRLRIGADKVSIDRVNVSQIVQLGGKLDIRAPKGFSPNLGDSFIALEAGTLVGVFDEAGLLLEGGKFLTPITRGNSVLLYVSLAGDANLDGKVDLSDFGALKVHFGMAGTLSEGNLNGDRMVDLSDFGVLKDNFGRAETATQVPEPSSAALVLACVSTAACLCGVRAWRRSQRETPPLCS